MSIIQNILKMRLLLGLTSAFSLALSTLANADPDLNCEAYAQSAMTEIQQGIDLGCGFQGLAWANDYALHFNWCKSPGVGIMDVSSEDQARLAGLEQCRKVNAHANQHPTNTYGEQGCTNYADMAVGFARDNVSLKCGLTDSLFDDNHQGHFFWCMSGVTKDEVTAANDRARSAITQCQENQTARARCGFYSVAMNPLYPRYQEACAGRDDFYYITASNDIQMCMDNNADPAWINQQVTEMNEKIRICEENIVTYVPNGLAQYADGCLVPVILQYSAMNLPPIVSAIRMGTPRLSMAVTGAPRILPFI